MWSFFFDSTSRALCRSYDAMLGFMPSACQTNAGRPALWATLAGLLVVFVAVRFAWSRVRAPKSSAS